MLTDPTESSPPDASPLASFAFEWEPWREQAACKGKNHLFFLSRGQSSAPAKNICRTCPVTRECEEYRRRTDTRYGIWAGQTAPGTRGERRDSPQNGHTSATVATPPTDGSDMPLKSLSATSAQMYENCPALWNTIYGESNYPPDIDNDAAKLGTVCHDTLLWLVSELVAGGMDRSSMPTLEEFIKHYQTQYEHLFTHMDFYPAGQKMLTEWYGKHPLFDGRKVLAMEVKKRFRIPVAGKQVPVNFIVDRLDQLSTGEFEVVDYKTSVIPVQPTELGSKVQARIYALGAQLENPDAERIKVTFDMLRYDPVSRWFTKEENRETYRYLVRLGNRIATATSFPETLNSDCRFCIRRHECGTLKKHMKVQGPLSITDPSDAADRRDEISNAIAVLKTMEKELDGIIVRYAEQEDLLEFDTERTNVAITAGKRRVFSLDAVVGIVGLEMLAGHPSVTLATIDEWLDSDDLTPEQKSQLRQAIETRYGDPKVKTSRVNQ